MLPALIHVHALHEGILRAPARDGLAAPDDGVVQEHGADDEEDEGDVDPAHPTDHDRTDVARADAVLEMDRRARKLLRHAFVALAAGGVEIGAIDGGAGIAGRQNVVDAVATGAVGGDHRAAFRGQAVIAVEVAGDAVPGYAELLRQAHALVAADRRCRERDSARRPASWGWRAP